MRSLAAATALLLLGPPAGAATVETTYVARVAGFRVMTVDVQATVDADAYRVAARLRSSGLASLATSFDQTATAEGRLLRDAVLPVRFRVEGDWQGEPRRVELALAASPARILLDPPDVPEREPVPPALARDSVDTLTALVTVSRQVAREGAAGCRFAATTFNGRRLTRVTLTPAGEGPVPGQTDMNAVRCHVETRQVAGFWRGWDRAQAERPQTGMIWIAAPVANAPLMPVRLEMGVDWLGTLVVSLDQARLAPIGPIVAR